MFRSQKNRAAVNGGPKSLVHRRRGGRRRSESKALNRERAFDLDQCAQWRSIVGIMSRAL